MKNCFLLILFLLFSCSVFSQNYTLVDAKVKQYPKQFRSIEYLARRINKDFTNKPDKLRAAYFWLANNIEYDYNAKDAIIKKVLAKDSFAKDLYNQNRYKYAETCLVKNKAVCAGYSLLLKYLLEKLDISSEYITGSAKTHPREIGVQTRLENHAWNAVKINNEWQLIDVTWSTGNEQDKPGQFKFSDTYYLIAPQKLILNHFPKDKKWQLLKQTVSKSSFTYLPLFYEKYFSSGLELNKSMSGLIKGKIKMPITLIFDTIDSDKNYAYSYKKDEYSTPIVFKKKDNKYYAQIPFNSTKKEYLLISNNTNGLIQFKIIPSVSNSY